ncbi:MAG: exodeoxyribonuclease VII large subunit [Candidatus Marinimicrobia bacterium]|nr:exodeoxyribonuclease VII large subunit [Candidatus Neomarinimicrobiota bacterium]MCF7830351.1 exodeoxyribonuclease VII large subunit [Candidatus Neomarinimicrobiota bacterium]MCF7882447.1 exodeoxyribonuclease VII large subunit [Candidatus Neomarinimicrobiota bacterium]
MPDRIIYSVSEINQQIKQILEPNFAGIWLEGELSNFKHHSSGHMYFSIKDADSEIRGVMWRGLNQSLRFRPEDGMQLLAQGDISVYEPRGQYQIVVRQMQPAGKGDLQVAFEQLKEKLREEGLFAEERKRPLPAYPLTIGVVTSPTGAAFRDILNVLQRRAPYVRVILAGSRVQGDGAAREIVRGIEQLNRLEEPDVIIIGRGGGSLEDLWPFNEEIVARAVVDSRLPIISAVGHEVDFSISDFCADYRAPTPSAAAEVVARDTDELLSELKATKDRLRERLQGRIERLKSRLESIESHYVFRIPGQRLETATQKLDDLYSRMESDIAGIIRDKSQVVASYRKQLELMHPDRILKRGYSITRDDEGKVIRNARDVEIGDILHTKFADGTTESEVQTIGEDNDRKAK